ncbi:MAG: hypothetical protein ACKVPX_02445 [Myxococcaceae bacterium]
MLNTDEELDHRRSSRLRHELEQAITTINRAQISTVTGDIKTTAFINVVQMVACLRARYLNHVLELGKNCHSQCITTEAALELQCLRQAYVEALEGFTALEHAVNRGYVHLND